MTLLRRAVGIGLAALALARPLSAQGYPKTPPPPGPLTPAPFPPFQETVLPNGLRLLVVESHKQPIVSLSLSFPAGTIHDPVGKDGVAEMVAGLLTKGAGKRTAEQVAEAIEGAGGSLNASASSDFLSVGSTVLTPSLPLALELVGDAVQRPSFADKEVELIRTQTLSGLQVQLTQPEVIADQTFRRVLYGGNPYGRSAVPATVRAIRREDLVAFQQTRLRPAGALLVVAGDVKLAEVKRLALETFRQWTGAPPAAVPPKPPAVTEKTQLILVHRPGSVQSNIIAGNLTYPPNDPRIYAAAVANEVLGGGASGRLFLILREQKSWTYGAYSRYARRKALGYFAASTEVRTQVTDSALTELMAQLRRIGAETVPPVELEAAKGSLVGSYPRSIETADQVADAVANARLYGLPSDYVQTYRVKVGAVTAAALQSTAKATIRPEGAVIVVVGDGTKIYDRIKGIAPVSIVDPEGKALTPDDLAPKATSLDLDLPSLVARRDSFTISYNGNPMGWLRGVVEKTADGFLYTEETHIGAFVNQTTRLQMDAAARMRSVKQTGRVQGMDTAIDVTYAGGRAKGTASAPDMQNGQMRLKSVTIDTVIAEGTLDDNAVQALIPAFRWQPAAKWVMNVLSAGQAEVKPWTLVVAAVDSVMIAGKTVRAYRADLTGPESPITFWVSSDAPHLLLKIAVAGQPLEFVRAP